MFKQILTGGSVLALLLVGGFSAQAKPQVSVLQAQTQEVPTPDTQTAPPAETIQPSTSPEGTTTPDATTPDATTPDATTPDATTPAPTTPEGTTPDITPDAGTPDTTSPDATTSPDSSGTSTPESTTSDSKQGNVGINCESNQIPEPTGGGSREFRECQQ